MADTIQLKAGNKNGMPNLVDREPAYVRDEKALYIGTPDGNVKIGEELETKVKELETKQTEQGTKQTEMETALGKKLEATKAAAVGALAAEADLATVVGKVNELIAELKAANIMNA